MARQTYVPSLPTSQPGRLSKVKTIRATPRQTKFPTDPKTNPQKHDHLVLLFSSSLGKLHLSPFTSCEGGPTSQHLQDVIFISLLPFHQKHDLPNGWFATGWAGGRSFWLCLPGMMRGGQMSRGFCLHQAFLLVYSDPHSIPVL